MKKLIIAAGILLLANIALFLWIQFMPPLSEEGEGSKTTGSAVSAVPESWQQPTAAGIPVSDVDDSGAASTQPPLLAPPILAKPELTPKSSPLQPVVYDIVLHKLDELEQLLNEIEMLSPEYLQDQSNPRIALVLHGPEIAYFTRDNYSQYRSIVDRTEKLVAAGAVDVNVCKTRMGVMALHENDFPDFVEFVPFGPGEVENREQQGYVGRENYYRM